MFKNLMLAAIILLCTLPGWGKKKEQPPDPAYAGITARGRMLAEYDTAVKHATDAVRATGAAEESLTDYVAKKTDARWVVAFGRLNDARDKFLITYQATQGGTPHEFKPSQNTPPLEDTGFFYLAAKALEISRHDFPRENRPYNFAVLPAESNQMYVYIYPAQTKPGIYTMGGDVRYLISPDGSSIVEKQQLHKSILEIDISGVVTKGKLEEGWHTDALSDVPLDTDVFYVLTRKPAAPEIVRTRKETYKVQADGTIVVAKMGH
jgi:hypothetical protein